MSIYKEVSLILDDDGQVVAFDVDGKRIGALRAWHIEQNTVRGPVELTVTLIARRVVVTTK